MLHIILLECAVELIPRELRGVKIVQQIAQKRKKRPSEMILDQSTFGEAMLRLSDHERRGRPDITFLSLLTILETPLCKEGLLSVHLHLQNGTIIEVDSTVRLPRNYDRFLGLFEQLLVHGRVPLKGRPLLQFLNVSLDDLINRLKMKNKSSLTFLTSEDGQATTISSLASLFPKEPSTPVIVGVGAFPHGDFSSHVKSIFKNRISLDIDTMMAWHVCAEILWTYSKCVNVTDKRLQQNI